ncbi:hypothetical protein ACIA98_41690 [Streptomyces sp. NPDC051366]|uniref:hypothetical protein n=1 Tax=Streptomyces sp. NPDC051366 TaxID=3365652 RepID=UPI0037B36F96
MSQLIGGGTRQGTDRAQARGELGAMRPEASESAELTRAARWLTRPIGFCAGVVLIL